MDHEPLHSRLAGAPGDDDLDALERELAWLRQQAGMAPSLTPFEGRAVEAADSARAHLAQARSALNRLPDAEGQLPALQAEVDRLNRARRGPIMLGLVLVLVVLVVVIGQAML